MNVQVKRTAADAQPVKRSKWMWIGLMGAACLVCWVALAVGIALEAGTTAMFVLATLAAVTTEGMIWLTALVLGVNLYQARRYIWRRLRRHVG
ncbi:MAG: hypothetical protein QM581_04710 [Pseudomonas sp.]